MTSGSSPVELRDFARELARGAGDILRTFAQHARTTIDTKSSSVDLVTDADRASEQFLVDAIRNRRPGDGILGEEGTNDLSTSGITWIIDPLDGTTNFVYSMPMYSVSIGATLDGVPVAGAVYNPILDEMYSASTGGGAFLDERPLRSNSIIQLETALVATGFAYESATRARQGAIAAALLPDIRDLRRAGSAALDLCNVASGRVDAYFEHSVKPWDVTAGVVIATEAGALATALDGGTPHIDILAAATPELHELLLARITA
jgi:myo-inositol-1(or 4)-monophosphatase